MSIDVKANEYFPGKVVRKDLTGRIKVTLACLPMFWSIY